MSRYAHSLVLLALATCPGAASADGVLVSWGGTDLEGMTRTRFEHAKTRTAEEILALNLAATSWPEVYEVALGARALEDREPVLIGLAAQVTSRKETPLTHTRRLIIWERITSGEIQFEGLGMQVDDDLFTVGGRANWALRSVTGMNFGTVLRNSTAKELAAIQSRWRAYLDGKEVAEVPDPYASQAPGLTELRSPQALQALITALAPSERKSATISRCLRDNFGLSELPADPHAPGAVCNPDHLTHEFLAAITQVSLRQAHPWWQAWWQINGSRLTWDPTLAKFIAPPPQQREIDGAGRL